MSERTLSVIIPTYNSGKVLGACLESVQRQTVTPKEVLVCDADSADDTAQVAHRFGAKLLTGQRNRSSQRNLGADTATSEYVLFIDSDMVLSPSVVENCLDSFGPEDAALVIPEKFAGVGFWGQVRQFERSFYDNIWWIQAARCYRKVQFEEMGGFDPVLIGPEDWDLDQRARRIGRVRSISAHIEHREGRARLGALLRKKQLYARSFSTFRERHPQRASMALSGRRRLAVLARQPLRAARHPFLLFGLGILGSAELALSRGAFLGAHSDGGERPVRK